MLTDLVFDNRQTRSIRTAIIQLCHRDRRIFLLRIDIEETVLGTAVKDDLLFRGYARGDSVYIALLGILNLG